MRLPALGRTPRPTEGALGWAILLHRTAADLFEAYLQNRGSRRIQTYLDFYIIVCTYSLKVLSLVEILQDEVNPMVSVMKVEKAPLRIVFRHWWVRCLDSRNQRGS